MLALTSTESTCALIGEVMGGGMGEDWRGGGGQKGDLVPVKTGLTIQDDSALRLFVGGWEC